MIARNFYQTRIIARNLNGFVELPSSVNIVGALYKLRVIIFSVILCCLSIEKMVPHAMSRDL